jgi:hypothetical protein
MSKLNQRFELTANVLIIVVAILFAMVLVQKYLLASPSPPAQSVRVLPKVGTGIDLANVKWDEQPKTLIFALQTTCGYCNASAPFYKRLEETVRGKNVRLIAVFPTPVAESSAHMTTLGLSGFDVMQESLEKLQTSGTPTLLLTNEKGEITKFWVGKLSPDKEAEVIQELTS